MKALMIAWIVVSTLMGIAWRLTIGVVLLSVAVMLLLIRVAESASPRPGDAASWSPRF
jgi:hypothetical protein